MPADTVRILDGNEFVVSDRQGDLEATPTENHGLFLDDTRFLSRWVLTVNGLRPKLLSVDDVAYFKVQFFAAVATGTVYVDSHLSVVRQRAVGRGFSEDITLTNHSRKRMELEVRLEAAADFADLFEVKDKLEKKGELYRRVTDHQLVLGYRRERFERQTVISADQPAEIREDGLVFRVRLEAQSEWTTRVDGRQAAARPRCRSRDGVRARRAPRPRHERAGLDRRGAQAGLVLGTARADLQALPGRSGGAALSYRNLPGRGSGGGLALVHGHLRPGQPHHELPGPSVRPRAGGHHPAAPGPVPGSGGRSVPGRGAGQDPARAPPRRDDGLRGAPALSVLWERGRDRPLPGAAGGVRALDRRHRARPRARARGARRDRVDRPSWRSRRRRVHRVRAAQQGDWSREPVLEGLLGLGRVRRRHSRPRAAGDLRAAGLCVRRQAEDGAPRPRGLEGSGLGGRARAAGRGVASPLQRGLLDRGSRLLRPRPRRAEAQGGLAHLQHRPPPVERDRRRRQG